MGVVIEVGKTYDAVQFRAVDPSEGTFDEAWLQETLRRFPEVLPVEEFGPVFQPLVPIGREVPTSAGSIDNLFISHAGYLVLVETKLWRNPEAKREVVAQLLDYATALSRLTYDEIDALVSDYLKRYEGGAASSLQDWVEARLGPVDVGFQSRVARNLKLGRFLLLIVTDHSRPTVVDLLKRLSAQAWLSVDIGVVELRPFKRGSDPDAGLLLVPYVPGRTEIVERSVVEVTVAGLPDAQVVVRKERRQDTTSGTQRPPVIISEAGFWELMHDKAPEAETPARKLIDAFRNEGFERELGESSIIIEAIIPRTELTVPLFFLKSNGKVAFWSETVRRRAGKAGVRLDLVENYVTQMLALLGASADKNAAYCRVKEIDVRAIQELALSFLKQIEAEAG